MIDSLFAALQKRSQAYEGISARFGFLRNVRSVSSDELSVQSAALVEWFPDDLEASLSGELVQFAALLDTDIGRQATNMYRLIRRETMQSCFPNVDILLRMYLSLTVTNCTGERSFSKLRRINNAQRTTIGKGRLNMLTLMSIDGRVAMHD